jgi:hypothetical protein
MKMESQVWYAEPAVELNPPSRGSDAAAAAAPPAAVAKSPVQGKRRQPVRAGVRRRGQPPGQGKRRPPARARAEELLNNHMPPAIPSDPPQALPGGGFFGKPLHSFARFRQQNAQTPPSPRVGEGGWGDEGANRRVRAGGARTQGISASSGRFFGKPLRTISRFSHQDAQTPPSPRVKERGRGEAHRVDVLASPCVPSPVSGSRTPKLPLLPVWEKGVGGMRGQTAGCAPEARAPRASPLPAAGFLASPCAPSPVSAIRTPRRPLLPV